MALKALSSWSSQNLPYGPLGLVLFLHSVLSNMLGEIRVQPACLSVDESAELWSMTGIHPDCSHSNKLGLKCLKWPGGTFIENHFITSLSQKSLLIRRNYKYLYTHICCFNEEEFMNCVQCMTCIGCYVVSYVGETKITPKSWQNQDRRNFKICFLFK